MLGAAALAAGSSVKVGAARLKRRWKMHALEASRRPQIADADCIVVSFPKSGRTWVRALLSQLYQRRYGLPEGLLIKYDNLHRLNAGAPKVLFTHDCDSVAPLSAFKRDKSIYAGRPIVLLYRHPLDAIVSLYFHMKHRREGQRINATRGLNIFDYVMLPGYSLELVLEYLNTWFRFARNNPDVLLIRYEDLRANPLTHVRRLIDFMGVDFSTDELKVAIDACSFESLRKREQEGHYADVALRPTGDDDPNSFKVRRGKVAGYLDYFSPDELVQLDLLVRTRLDPEIGYAIETAADDRRSAATRRGAE